MKNWLLLVSFPLLLSLVAACGGGGLAVEAVPELAGPALVMFYTDA